MIVSTASCFTYWVCDCLYHFEDRLKGWGPQVDLALQAKAQQGGCESLGGLLVPGGSHLLRELEISPWDVYWRGLPIVGDVYDEFFSISKLILDKKHPASV